MVGWIGFKLGEHVDATFTHPPVTLQWPKTASCRHSMGSSQHRLGAQHEGSVVGMQLFYCTQLQERGLPGGRSEVLKQVEAVNIGLCFV